MMNRRMSWSIAGLVLGALLAARTADADAVYTAAGACQWQNLTEDFRPLQEGEVKYYGTTGAEHRISCDLPRPNDVAASTTDDLYVYYDDRNAGSSMEHSIIHL